MIITMILTGNPVCRRRDQVTDITGAQNTSTFVFGGAGGQQTGRGFHIDPPTTPPQVQAACREPFNSTPMGVNSASFAHLHVRRTTHDAPPWGARAGELTKSRNKYPPERHYRSTQERYLPERHYRRRSICYRSICGQDLPINTEGGWKIENAIELLDADSEFHFDTNTRTLYLAYNGAHE